MYSQFEVKKIEPAFFPRKKSTLLIQPGHFQSSQKYVVGPKITLPSGQAEQTAVRTDPKPVANWQKERPPLSLFQTAPIIPETVKWQIGHSQNIERSKAQHMFTASWFFQGEEEALTFQTFPLRAVKSKRVEREFRSIFASVFLFCTSLLALGAGTALILAVPGILYKSTVLMVLLIVLSYLASFLVKRAYQARQQYLTMKQLTETRDKKAAAGKDDLQHLTLIKQDTTGYLRALTTSQLKKGLQG